MRNTVESRICATKSFRMVSEVLVLLAAVPAVLVVRTVAACRAAARAACRTCPSS